LALGTALAASAGRLLVSSSTAPATTPAYPLSLHDALPIYQRAVRGRGVRLLAPSAPPLHAARQADAGQQGGHADGQPGRRVAEVDRKSNTSELQSRENLVCRLLLEKKNTNEQRTRTAEVHR